MAGFGSIFVVWLVVKKTWMAGVLLDLVVSSSRAINFPTLVKRTRK